VRVLATRLIVGSLIAVAAGCGSGPSLDVEVCGDARASVDALQLTVLDASRAPVGSGLQRLGPADALPLRLTVPSGPDAAWLRLQGLFEGLEVLRFERRLDPMADGPVLVALEGACAGARCVLGQTCLGGVCEPAPETDAAVACEACGDCREP
jgi:hypothetical protein